MGHTGTGPHGSSNDGIPSSGDFRIDGLMQEVATLRQQLTEAQSQLARGVAHAKERVGLIQELVEARALLREACDVARAPDDDPERWYGNEITDEWFDKAEKVGGDS
jgi:hypothetical protein